MLAKAKSALTSEKGMNIVNFLFVMSMFVRGSAVLSVAYVFWIAYLAFGIKRTPYKTLKIVFGIFIGLAVCMIALNVYFLITQ